MEENDLIRMLRLISKFFTPWTGTKTTTIHIFPNHIQNVLEKLVPALP